MCVREGVYLSVFLHVCMCCVIGVCTCVCVSESVSVHITFKSTIPFFENMLSFILCFSSFYLFKTIFLEFKILRVGAGAEYFFQLQPKTSGSSGSGSGSTPLFICRTINYSGHLL